MFRPPVALLAVFAVLVAVGVVGISSSRADALATSEWSSACADNGGTWQSAAPKRAAKCTSMNPTSEVKGRALYLALSGCIQDRMYGDIESSLDVDGQTPPSSWFNNDTFWINGEPHVYPGAKESTCAQVAQDALKFFGYGDDYEQFLNDMGYVYKLEGGKAKWHGTSNGDERKNKFESLIKDGYYGGNEPGLSDAATYVSFLEAFTRKGGKCMAKDLGVYPDLGGNASYKQLVDEEQEQNAATSEIYISGGGTVGTLKYTKVNIVDTDTGEVEQHGYAYLVSESTYYGYGSSSIDDPVKETLYGYRPRTSIVYSCNDLIAGLNSKAAAMKKWIGDHKEDGGSDVETGTGTTTPVDDDLATSCDIDGTGWILCPILTTGAKIADGAYGFLADQFLSINASLLDPSGGVYKSWGIMRTIANVLLVIGFIAIVFSQITGLGIQNYGVKRMLPRLVVMAILINASFWICAIVVDLSNILGYGLKTLLANVGGQVLDASSTTGPMKDQGGNAAGWIAIVLGGAGLLWLNLGAAMLAILGAIVSLLTIFVLLIVRQALVVLLIVSAPVAFAAQILPNTEGLFKKWRQMFTSLLMLFPLIGLLYGACILASRVIYATIPADPDPYRTIWQIISYFILVVPLIAIIPLLKGSLDGVGKIGVMIQQAGNKSSSLAQGGAKRGVAAYKNSNLGKFRAGLKGRRDAEIAAGVFAGSNRNPLNWARNLRSGVNKRINRSGAVDAITGGYGSRMTAMGAAASAKADSEAIGDAEQVIRNEQLSNPAAAERSFWQAIDSGDSVQARAAQNVLFSQGGAGIDTVRRTIAHHQDRIAAGSGPGATPQQRQAAVASEKALQSIRSNIQSNHGDTRNKAADIAAWASQGGRLETHTRNASTWTGMSAEQMAGQTKGSLMHATPHLMTSPAGVALATNVIADDKLRNGLSGDKQDVIVQIRDGTGSTTPPSMY
ncbi:hypothetical protein [Microbacterium sp. NPDC076895]|uniref:hypothetical protein n=1 Tax=Microbacterium sp. NPDC076895 TaxID=3154957 RepID=UPI0034128E18